MPNQLHVVKKKGGFPGDCFTNVQGFDYRDEATGLSINVRDKDTEIRILGVMVTLERLKALLDTGVTLKK